MLLSIVCFGQSRPLNEFAIRGGNHWIEPVKVKVEDGGTSSLEGWRPRAWGVDAAYRRWLLPAHALGLGVGVFNAPFTYQFEMDFGKLGHPAEGTRLEKEIPVHNWLLTIGAEYIYRKRLSERIGIHAFVKAGVGGLRPSTSNVTGHIGYLDTTNILYFRRMDRFNEQGELIPLVKIGLGLDRQFLNWDRVSLDVEYLHSFKRDIFQSDYILYPKTIHEEHGRIYGSVSYIGFRLGYVFTWGAPKEPAYIRKQRRKEGLEMP